MLEGEEPLDRAVHDAHDGWYGKDDAITRIDCDLSVCEFESCHPVGNELERPQPAPERNCDLAFAQPLKRRVHEHLCEPGACEEWSARLSAPRQSFRHHRASELRARLIRLGVERCQPERPGEPLV